MEIFLIINSAMAQAETVLDSAILILWAEWSVLEIWMSK